MNVVGQIIHKGKKEQFTENFAKAELWVKTIEEYPNYFKIEFHNGNIDLLANWNEGDNVKVGCNLKGRLVTAEDQTQNIFMTLKAWKIEAA